MDRFKLKAKNKKKSEEELKKSMMDHAAKEHDGFKVTGWTWDEEIHEGIVQMEKK